MNKRLTACSVILLLGGCQGVGEPRPYVAEPVPYEGTRSIDDALPEHAVLGRDVSLENFIEPDLVPVVVRVCRTPEGISTPYGGYMRWDVQITLQNQHGNLNLTATQAPVDVYVSFDPDRPYGVNNETGEAYTLGEYDSELLRDMPEQQWMSVPRAGNFGGAAFSLWYVEGGPGSRYRRVPTGFTVMLDQFRGNNPSGGIVDESDEGNNGVQVTIDRYDEINGRTGRRLISCWYGNGNE